MNETVYREKQGPHSMSVYYEPITPNPLDEVERLKTELSVAFDGPTVDEWMAILREKDAENVRLRLLLRDARDHIKRIEGPTDIGLVLDAALNGEPCKHERWVTEVVWDGPVDIRVGGVFCASCGTPADKVQP